MVVEEEKRGRSDTAMRFGDRVIALPFQPNSNAYQTGRIATLRGNPLPLVARLCKTRLPSGPTTTLEHRWDFVSPSAAKTRKDSPQRREHFRAEEGERELRRVSDRALLSLLAGTDAKDEV